MAASKRDFNQHTLSYLGKVDGRSIKVRRLGRSKGQSTLARPRALVATRYRDQGTSRKSAQQLSKEVRQDPGLKEFRVGSGARDERLNFGNGGQLHRNPKGLTDAS